MMRMLVTGGSGFIGTNLIDALLEGDATVLNLDINPPKKEAHLPYWRECDILDCDRTLRYFRELGPTHVVHLAARTDTLSNNLEEYKVNTEGTFNVLACIKITPSVERVIITSSQFVFGPPGLPRDAEDFEPMGAYGMSKVISEKATRSAGLECIWTITRPTNIWGPWHPRYPHEFWLVLKKGLYFHPGGRSTVRSYGYVGNIVFQMMRIMEAPAPLVDRKVYYLGDPPIPLMDWVNGFSVAITGKPARTVPSGVLRMVAALGSLVGKIGIRAPLTLSRYASMTEDYFSPMEATMRDFGVPPYSLEEGVGETVAWLDRYWEAHGL